MLTIKNIVNIVKCRRDYCHYTEGAAHSICSLKYSITKEITIVFHNGSNYDYHFIMKEQTEEFEG